MWTSVIAALRVVLREAEKCSHQFRWKTSVVNRWVKQLPGAWAGRWRHLKLRGDIDREVTHPDLVAHVRATLAYLEVNRDKISRLWPWSFRRGKGHPEPIDAVFQDVAEATEKPLKKTRKAVVLIGGSKK
jgi:hypothetical protein